MKYGVCPPCFGPPCFAGEGSQEAEKWGGGHGVFTHFLLEGLKGKADRNKDGFITIKETFNYLYSKVQRESENGQTPFASAYLDNSIPLGVCEPGKLRLITAPKAVGDGLVPSRPAVASAKETAELVEYTGHLPPDHKNFNYALGLYKSGKPDKAITVLGELISKDCTVSPKAMHLKIAILIAPLPSVGGVGGEGIESAEDLYIKLKSFYPESPSVSAAAKLLENMKVSIEKQAYDKYLTQVNNLIDPNERIKVLEKFIRANSKNRYADEAQKLISTLLAEIKETNRRTYERNIRLAQSYREAKKYDEAMEALKTAKSYAENPKEVESLITQIQTEYKKHQLYQKEQEYNKWITEAKILIALYKKKIVTSGEALTAIDNALKYKPNDPEALALKKKLLPSLRPGVTSVLLETNFGNIVITLFSKDAPNTVDNFIKLIEKGFYKGLTFHRIVPTFVIQGGCPKGNGAGGPGYTIKAEFNSRKHLTGTVAMARAQDPDSAGSQFYICLAPQPHLDGKYTVFGQVIEGMDVVKKISKVKTTGPGKPLKSVKIIRATISQKPVGKNREK